MHLPVDNVDTSVFQSFEAVRVFSDSEDCAVIEQDSQTIRFPTRLICEVIAALAQAEKGDR